MIIEDFTRYTEVDPNTLITVAANQVSWVGQTRPEKTYVYKPWTIPVDTDFEHLLEMSYGPTTGTQLSAHWMVADRIGAMNDIDGAGGSFWSVFSYQGQRLRVWIVESGSKVADVNGTITLETPYWLKIIGDVDGGGAGKGRLTVEVYNDADRTSLHRSIVADAVNETIASFATHLYANCSYGQGNAADLGSGYTKDLDLQEQVNNPRYYYQRNKMRRAA